MKREMIFNFLGVKKTPMEIENALHKIVLDKYNGNIIYQNSFYRLIYEGDLKIDHERESKKIIYQSQIESFLTDEPNGCWSLALPLETWAEFKAMVWNSDWNETYLNLWFTESSSKGYVSKFYENSKYEIPLAKLIDCDVVVYYSNDFSILTEVESIEFPERAIIIFRKTFHFPQGINVKAIELNENYFWNRSSINS